MHRNDTWAFLTFYTTTAYVKMPVALTMGFPQFPHPKADEKKGGNNSLDKASYPPTRSFRDQPTEKRRKKSRATQG